MFRSPRHIYAQVVSPSGDRVEVAASTVESDLRGTHTGNVEGAAKVGSLIADRAKEKGIEKVALAEIARSESYLEGRVPLHTLRADID